MTLLYWLLDGKKLTSYEFTCYYIAYSHDKQNNSIKANQIIYEL